jgi:hypothetical protein
MPEAVPWCVSGLFLPSLVSLTVAAPLQDLAVYQILGHLATLEIAEMCARSGANCGSLFLDSRFRELVRTILVDHPAHLDSASLAYFMHSFSETDKLAYRGQVDDGAWSSILFQPLPINVFFLQILHSTSRVSTWKTRMTLGLAWSMESSPFGGVICAEKSLTLL